MIKIEFSGPRATGKTVLTKAVQQLLASAGVVAQRDTSRETVRSDRDVLFIDNDFDPATFVQRFPIATLSGLTNAIQQWATARNLIEGATPQAQTVKLFEEGGEVAHAVARGDLDKLKDGIGDMVVVLTILAAQNGLTLEECVAAAYDEIKDRTGRMVDGVFVKDEA